MQRKKDFPVFIYKDRKGADDLDDKDLINLYWNRKEEALRQTDKKYIIEWENKDNLEKGISEVNKKGRVKIIEAVIE